MAGEEVFPHWTSDNNGMDDGQEGKDQNGIICAIAVNNADQATYPVLLVPVEIKARDGQVNHGFDPPMQGVPAMSVGGETYPAVDPDAADEPVWTSVIQGESSDSTVLVVPESIAPITRLIGANQEKVTLAPHNTALTAAETSIALAGNYAGDAPEAVDVTVQIAGTDLPVPGLRAMLLPKREISLGIYRVYDSHSPDTYVTNPDGSKSLGADVESNDQILATMNDIYKQAGISFVLAGAGTLDRPYDSDWDGDGQNDGDGDGRADDGFNDGNPKEMDWLAKKLRDEGKAGSYYLILTRQSGRQYKADSTKYIRGTTPRDQTYSILWAATIKAAGGNVDRVAAHEVGHGLKLLDHEYKPYPSGTYPLMISGGPVGGVIPSNPGLWMKHDDWEVTNNKAEDYAP